MYVMESHEQRQKNFIIRYPSIQGDCYHCYNYASKMSPLAVAFPTELMILHKYYNGNEDFSFWENQRMTFSFIFYKFYLFLFFLKST